MRAAWANLSLADWRAATGLETRDGKSTVGNAKSDATKLADDYRLRDPRRLDRFAAFEHVRVPER